MKSHFNTTIFLVLFPIFCLSNENLSISDLTRASDEDCTEVRLDKKNGIMADIPIQDQGDTGFCWSYAGTQLIDAWRAKYPPPGTPPWSAPDALSFEYLTIKGITNPSPISPVSMHDFLLKSSQLRSCDYSEFNKKRFESKKDAKFFQRFEELHRLLRNGGSDDQINDLYKTCFSGFRPQNKSDIEIQRIRNIALEKNWTTFTRDVLREYCEDKTRSLSKLPSPVVTYADETNNGVEGVHRIQKVINNQLNRAKIDPKALPVGIQFCPEIFFRPMSPTIGTKGKLDRSACKTVNGYNRGMHTSVIVGRRPAVWTNPENPNHKIKTCQYLIRNSEGTSCDGFRGTFKMGNPPREIFTPSDRCAVNDGKETGQIWVDEISLLGNTDVAYTIPDRPN